MLAAYLAAHAESGARAAVRALARLPVTYAIAAGIFLDVIGLVPPAPIEKAVQLLANGGIAVMLLLIGVQLTRVRPAGEWPVITAAAVTRLGVAPVLAWVTTSWVGLEGVARQQASCSRACRWRSPPRSGPRSSASHQRSSAAP